MVTEEMYQILVEYAQGLTLISITIWALLIGGVVWLGFHWLFKKRIKLPPGPRPLPLLGNIFSFSTTETYKKLYEMSKKYGPAMTLYVGTQPYIFLNRIDVVLDVLVKRGADFAGRKLGYTADYVSDNGQDIILADYGAGWKLRRRIATKALRHYLTGRSLEVNVGEAVTKAMDLIEKEPGPVDPNRHLFLITVNILCAVCFGKCYEHDNPEFLWLFEQFDTFLTAISSGFILEEISPIFRIVHTSNFTKAVKAHRNTLNFTKARVDEHRRTFSRDNMRDLTDNILLAQKEVEDQGDDAEALAQFTDNNVAHIIHNVFNGGMDTTRLTTNWTLLFLAAYPDIQSKVHRELDAVIGREKLPTLADREKLPYTEAVLHESMRVAPAVPNGVMHTAVVDTKIGDYDVPKGTKIVINQWAVHHETDQWEDVQAFKPERFLDDSGKLAPKTRSWIPFSAGRRICMGETVAKPELHLILATIMQRFKLSMPLGVTADLKPASEISFYIPKRQKIVFEKRN